MISLLKTYYGQDEAIKRQLDEKLDIPFVVVDDGYPEPLKMKGVKVYRIEEDIPWNQATAKNLGVSKLNGWIVLLDADHILTKDNLKDIRKLKLKRGTLYYFNRERDDGEPEPESINAFLIHRKDFDKVKYDEDFSGHYGFEDIYFYKQAAEILKIERLDIKVKVFYQGGIYKGETKGDRDYSFNQLIYDRKINGSI